MSKFSFQPATKKQARLRLALIGPAGSGKTMTALKVAFGMAKKVAVIDTEHGSASKYAGAEFPFDTVCLDSFHPQNYVDAIRAAEEGGYEVIIIDSLSHAWVGKDGGLELHDRAVARQKTANKFTAWSEVTPHHNALIEAMLQSPCHLIATMRAKTEYVMDEKNRPKKVGMAPVMRDGIEYEFDVAGDLDAEHRFIVSKTRCPALNGAVIDLPGGQLAKTLLAWLSDGAPESLPQPAPQQAQAPAPKAEPSELTEAETQWARERCKGKGDWAKRLLAVFGVAGLSQIRRRVWSLFALCVGNDVDPAWLREHVLSGLTVDQLNDTDLASVEETLAKKYRKAG